MQDSLWFTTRSALFEQGDQAWDEVARYDQPLRRLLARRYGRVLGEAEREDLVQEILIEIKQKLASTFDGSRGKFRALLQTVVARRVTDQLRRARSGTLPEDLRAPSDEVLDALDLEAALVRAVGACRDAFSGGPSKDLAVLHALTDRLVHGLSATQIAKNEGVSRDRVGRLLGKGRDVIYAHLLAEELGLAPTSAELESCVQVFKRCLRKPVALREHMEQIEDPPVRERFETFWSRFKAALPHFEGDETAAGRELAQGVELLLGTVEGEDE